MRQEEIDARLIDAADEPYRKFNAKIVKSNLPMWGVRAPFLQALAREIALQPNGFFDWYKAENYEQILLYALTLAKSKLPYADKLPYLDALLPKLENWAHVDMTVSAFKQLGKNRDAFLSRYAYLTEAPEFERRFMVVFLMDYCLTEERLNTVFDLYEKMQCNLYYVNMGIAWGISVALVKFYEQTVAFLQKGTLTDWVLRKSVQKARESYRLTAEQKEFLKSLL